MTDTQKRVAMGYIKGVFGIKGWLKIAANTEYTDSLLDYPEWQLCKDGKTLNVVLEAGKIVNGELQVKFEGIDDRDQAFALRGYTIEIPRESFAPTEEDEYYWADLVGMTVINKENIVLGKVSNLMETGANDVLMIKGEHGQILIPFVSNYIESVDTDSKPLSPTGVWTTDADSSHHHFPGDVRQHCRIWRYRQSKKTKSLAVSSHQSPKICRQQTWLYR